MNTVICVCSLLFGYAASQSLATSLRNNINPFGVQLYNSLCAEQENCVISPYSLYVLTSMLASGADGLTFQELITLMNVDDFTKSTGFLEEVIKTLDTEVEGYKMSSANSIYTDLNGISINSSYKETIQNTYQGMQKQLPLKTNPEEARTTINNDISAATNGLIQDLLPPGSIGTLTEMILTNAIYFKANWLLPFEIEQTVPADFRLASGEVIQVPTMFVSGEFRYQEFNWGTLLELPYVTRFESNWVTDKIVTDNQDQEWDVSMVLLLPDENVSLEELDMSLYIEESQMLISTTKAKFQTPVDVYLPKFEIDFDAGSIREEFASLGLTSAFDPATADFSKITDFQGLYVSDIFHKAKIIVNEEGTEAAAAAAAFLNFESIITPFEIRFDRPFGFMLIYKPVASVLFMGKVGNPGSGAV
eukprot:TRINITY_DN1376_c0_g1_i1.p1 TRINITY_DN1376_c0_g1~~TRINITY_DN1376_c0_g1_i1.p1  ORF type:complete len:451 (-),score=78.20 TRINITY_DN1376_c0_g1_i1:1991-3247(-)